MALAGDSDHHGTLLHCLCCILDLEYPTLRRAGELLLALGFHKQTRLNWAGCLQGDGIVVVVIPEHCGGPIGSVVGRVFGMGNEVW